MKDKATKTNERTDGLNRARGWGWRAGLLILLWGTATIGLRGQSLSYLYEFSSLAEPQTALIQGADGNLYGTTTLGGTGAYCTSSQGCGTIFQLTPGGTLTTVYNFCSQPGCADGVGPGPGEMGEDSYQGASLVLASDGNFYGTTVWGGTNPAGEGMNQGTIFRLTPDFTLTTLYTFCQQPGCADGAQPFGLIQGINGNLYGATYFGGPNEGPTGAGTIFQLSLNGEFSTFYSFCPSNNCGGGYAPVALIQGMDGNFYGATSSAGTFQGSANGPGTIFKLTPGGQFTVLYTLAVSGGIGYPVVGIGQGSDGNFYGTTLAGGTGTNATGTVFEFTLAGTFSTLYQFIYGNSLTDYSGPSSGVIQATDGNLYGEVGSPGAVFELTTGGFADGTR